MIKKPFRSVLEDVDWLWNEWWIGQPDELTEGHLRRGSATLRLLLVDGLLCNAWRHYGFEKQPTVEAPDIVALAERRGYRLDLAASVIAGGGRQNGLDVAFVGAFRVDNPSTEVLADAEAGFAVEAINIARQATDPQPGTQLDPLVHRKWYISEYLDSLSAVRRGNTFTAISFCFGWDQIERFGACFFAQIARRIKKSIASVSTPLSPSSKILAAAV